MGPYLRGGGLLKRISFDMGAYLFDGGLNRGDGAKSRTYGIVSSILKNPHLHSC